MEKNLLTTAEVAEILGVSPSRVRQLVMQGKLVGVKITGAWFFTREAVEQVRKQRRGKSW